MRFEGTARLDRRTKDLVKRLGRNDIAVIDHIDMDRVSAEGLLETGVEVVVNAAPSISGAYPNVGPLLLVRGGVRLIDNVGQEVFERVRDGDIVEIIGDDVLKDGVVVASGERMTFDVIEQAMENAKAGLGEQLDRFARNTLEFLEKEKALLTEGTGIPETKVRFAGRHVLVVVRGYDYKQDLQALKPYIREMRPILIGVDGGADAIMEVGFKPDIIVGDMDSVTDTALTSGAELIVHAYADGRCPGMARLHELGVDGITWPLSATSEDLALLLAHEAGADLIVAVGTHANLVEYLDKGRKGMASSFLVRLKVGPRLVDAKGVSRLWRATVKPSQLVYLVAAALTVVTTIILISPPARDFVMLLILRLRTSIGL
ncbi:MAG: putative cytokinetic ring protein SteA [Coriobacteriia bacterium]|nr:putative cytokinetic ring protein SteA [Coriobacteriia bacterium]